jgi:uncharacterized cupredoxin-like copper-binding protein
MRKLPALLAAGAAVLAGCGGGPSYARDKDAVLRITLDEYRLSPENVSVRAGRITLVAHNGGRLTHNLAVEEFTRREGVQPHEYVRTATVHAGQTVRSDVVLAPGKYRLTCTIANHDDLGQYGELKVTAR